MIELFSPIYPALARQANIYGDVVVQVSIRKDGSVESALLLSGHPMLAPAALGSARQSHFECRNCDDEVTAYSVTYAFEMPDDGNCCNALSRAPEVSWSLNRISIVAPHLCICDLAGVILGKKIRASKCLYLWKCG